MSMHIKHGSLASGETQEAILRPGMRLKAAIRVEAQRQIILAANTHSPYAYADLTMSVPDWA